MKINKIIMLVFLVTVFFGMPFRSQAQKTNSIPSYPKIGEDCPEFIIKKVYDGAKKHISKIDIKGEWTVLYFWSRWCTTSMTNLEKIEALQKKLNGQVSFLIIGKEDSISKSIYREFKRSYNLTIPHAFQEDLINAFGIVTYPHIITLGPDGKVRAISMNISEEGIDHILGGADPNWPYSQNAEEKQINKMKFNREKPFLTGGNGGEESEVLYRSVLMPWKTDMPITGVQLFRPGFRSNEVLISGVDLARLYQLAYGSEKVIVPASKNNDYGNWWYRPILEVKDSTVFRFENNSNAERYTYSLIVPKERSGQDLMRTHMQRDLDSYFGYKVTIENRMMPYWRLLASEKARKNLMTKGGTPKITGDGIIATQFINQPISSLINLLWGYNQNGAPFIDETKITTPIDISLKGRILINFKKLREALNQKGLYLKRGEKLMKVIVIRDIK